MNMVGQFQSYGLRSLRITTLWKSHAIPNFCDFDAHGTLASKEHLCKFFFKEDGSMLSYPIPILWAYDGTSRPIFSG